MPLIVAGKDYSIDTSFEKFVTFNFLRHVSHGNRFRFESISEDGVTKTLIMAFRCVHCDGAIDYQINNMYFADDRIRLHTNIGEEKNSFAIHVTWGLIGTDVAIAHLVDYEVYKVKLQEDMKIAKNPNLAFEMMKSRQNLTKEF
jgi:hypothetical protein